MKILLTLFLLVLAFQISFGQDNPKAEKIEDFDSDISDSVMRSKIDNMLFSVMPENSKALFIIYENEANTARKYIIENWVSFYLKLRNVPIEKYSITFAANKEKPNTNFLRFYKIPENAEMPIFIEVPKDFKISKLSKELHFYSSGADNSDILFDTELFANLLKSNPSLVGKIVVCENNKISRKKKIIKIFKELTSKYKIPINQLKIFYSKNSDQYPSESYSLIPKERAN